ncbi:MAG: DsbA family protein, partial [Methanosarcinales archaeon]|nr:DsbA family protein [Methanosarcinales archaeon]
KGEEMKEAIFTAQFVNGFDIDDVAILESLASDIGLGDEFNQQLESESAKSDVLANIRAFKNVRSGWTPTIVITGKGQTIMLSPPDVGDDMNVLAQRVDATIAGLL